MIRIVCAWLLALLSLGDVASQEVDSDRVFFERRIRPILAEHCYGCHSEESGKRKGGLWLDRKAGWELGGDSGAAIVPGHPEESLFIQTVRYEDPDLEMPPEEKLPPEVIARLEEWVQRGAHDPRDGKAVVDREEIDVEEGRKFWSFQPISDPAPPEVQDASWPRSDLDRFLLARLEAEGLSPALDANRTDLLRRVTLILTGLPPTVEEQEAFQSDPGNRDEAMARVVDRLLASDAYAERWGRHWLDIMRYSDTSGGGRAMALPDAWRFRDFVIDSFREDKPLDHLIHQHIAGDLLPYSSAEERMKGLIATGFLVLGPHNYENQDKELLDLEIADEQIDTIGRAFLGMTIGCARCHDHKFDPIPTQDYYSLAGIFLSTKSVTHANVSKWSTRPYKASPEDEAAIARYEREKAPLTGEIDRVKKEIQRLGFSPSGSAASSTRSISLKRLRGIARDNLTAKLVGDWQESTSQPLWVDEGYIHDQQERSVLKSVTWTIPIEKPGLYEVRLSYSASGNRATNTPVIVQHAGGEKSMRIDQTKKAEHDGLFHTVGRFRFENQAVVRITNEDTDGVVIVDAVQLLSEADQNRSSVKEDPGAASRKETPEVKKLRDEYKKLTDRLKELEKSKPKLPTIMAVAEGEEPADTAIRVRGLPRTLGEVAPRGFLQVAHEGEMPSIGETGSGRLQMAEWVASPDNPLTARVIANRIWLHLFGEGIVSSPDNFGTTGNPPSHPELLDHLATRLIAHDWSARALIREIVLSRAWQMSSAGDHGAEADPENTLLWRAHRRRVDAETLRDSILAISGALDKNRGGPSLPEGFKSEFGYEYTSLKRSVYIPVFRNRMHEIFGAFDFANPNFVVGKRSSSTIPTQSLYLLNNPFMHEQAESGAKSLLSDLRAATNRDRIVLAYRKILGREPRSEELNLALEFLGEHSEDPEPWTGFVHSLLSCVDFQYIY